MKFFYWNANFDIGIPEIDRQHQTLVEMINSLASVITEGGQLPKVNSLINELLDYAAVHFADEEALMETTTLSEMDKARHRKTHEGFVAKVREIAQHEDLQQTEFAEKILDFLTTWLISHILGSDKEIARAADRGVAEIAAGPSLLEVSPVAKVLINALTETERRFRLISDCAPALIWVSDANGERSYYNRGWFSFVGIYESDAGAFDYLSLIHPDDRAPYQGLIAGLLRNASPGEAEYRVLRQNGDYAWVLERIMPRLDVNGQFVGLIASATDITVIKQSEALLSAANRSLEEEVARRTAQLEEMTQTDPLTGIGNRRLLDLRLGDEIRRAQRHRRPLTAIYFDLDHFKQVNDSYGHSTGDQVLMRVARSFKANLDEADLVVRFGGEEFVVLLVETGLDHGWRTAERLRAAVSRIRLKDLGDRQVTVSAGVAEWQHGETPETFLRRADRALYDAKREGRNCCRVDLAA